MLWRFYGSEGEPLYIFLNSSERESGAAPPRIAHRVRAGLLGKQIVPSPAAVFALDEFSTDLHCKLTARQIERRWLAQAAAICSHGGGDTAPLIPVGEVGERAECSLLEMPIQSSGVLVQGGGGIETCQQKSPPCAHFGVNEESFRKKGT